MCLVQTVRLDLMAVISDSYRTSLLCFLYWQTSSRTSACDCLKPSCIVTVVVFRKVLVADVTGNCLINILSATYYIQLYHISVVEYCN
jgi:hypothetical protein